MADTHNLTLLGRGSLRPRLMELSIRFRLESTARELLDLFICRLHTAALASSSPKRPPPEPKQTARGKPPNRWIPTGSGSLSVRRPLLRSNPSSRVVGGGIGSHVEGSANLMSDRVCDSRANISEMVPAHGPSGIRANGPRRLASVNTGGLNETIAKVNSTDSATGESGLRRLARRGHNVRRGHQRPRAPTAAAGCGTLKPCFRRQRIGDRVEVRAERGPRTASEERRLDVVVH